MPGRLIIKPDQGRDEYVLWSTIVEAPLALGTAAQITEWLMHDQKEPVHVTRERIARADATGTSSVDGDGAFGDFMIFEQRGTIACSKLADLTRCLLNDNLDGAYDLCEPFDDKTEVVRG